MPRLPRFLLPVLGAHILLLAAYTGPERWVPPRLRAWSVAWVRPLFHQGWDLFAPDPPRCSCVLQARAGNGPWRALAHEEGLLARRMARHLAAYAGGGAVLPDTLVLSQRWAPAMRTLAIREGVGPRSFRAVQRCLEGPSGALWLKERTVPIQLTGP